MLSGLGGAVMQGMAVGTGSAIAHRWGAGARWVPVGGSAGQAAARALQLLFSDGPMFVCVLPTPAVLSSVCLCWAIHRPAWHAFAGCRAVDAVLGSRHPPPAEAQQAAAEIAASPQEPCSEQARKFTSCMEAFDGDMGPCQQASCGGWLWGEHMGWAAGLEMSVVLLR